MVLREVECTDFKWLFDAEFSGGPYKVLLDYPLFGDGGWSFEQVCRDLAKKFCFKDFEAVKTKGGVVAQGDNEYATTNMDRFLTEPASKSLYLAQYPIYRPMTPSDFYNFDGLESSKDYLRKQNQAQIQLVRRNLKIPSFLFAKLERLSMVNVWINQEGTTSAWHFDLYENFLGVVSGAKSVSLLPRESVPSDLPNDQIDSFIKKNPSILATATTTVVREGQILKIPLGWLHTVRSDPQTIAFNFWFPNCLQENPALAPALVSQFTEEQTYQRLANKKRRSKEEESLLESEKTDWTQIAGPFPIEHQKPPKTPKKIGKRLIKKVK